MTCARYHRWIGADLEGTLHPADRIRLQAHLAKCRECRELADDFRRIAAEASALPKDEPDEDVWPKIKAGVLAARTDGRRKEAAGRALRPEFIPFGRRWAWGAALLFAGLAIGLIVGLRPWKGGAPSPLLADERSTVAKLDEAEQHYRLAIQALNEALTPEARGFDPQTTALFQSDLKVVDSAIASCRAALARDPRSIDARIFLLSAYEKKVEVLNGFMDMRKRNEGRSEVRPGL